ncbi:hypothetical protein AC477_04105 [miscellaneous Crenarchaeota group-1 archaeon SG8-32-1]|uniref:Uncharacterized protein n=1 Tax=miscellaneous Crenarchaeota group-1 archaeon SG8-32-1 TaxID=1685124 RepID=A0A0M0BSM0_9ARCH|nr:MAG: hypothetical protein AC477_04105 [miscellaneous Crenarchaeota group-1 archaeon SG8-32-1]
MSNIAKNISPESFEPFEIVDSYIKKWGKTRNWLNTLSSREKLIPRPIRQPRVSLLFQQNHKRGKIAFHRQGSVVFYPKGTGKYLEEIIHLHDVQGLSYRKIREKLKGKLDGLNRMVDASLIQDKRVKDAGFFYNYRAAIKLLVKFNVLDKIPESSNQWKGLYEKRVKYGREYYDAVEKMRRSLEEDNIPAYDIAKNKRDNLGEQLDFIHAVMETVIKHTLKFLETKYPKGSYMKDWFEAVKEVEKEG